MSSPPTLLGGDRANCIRCGTPIVLPPWASVPLDEHWRARMARCEKCAPILEAAYEAGEQVAAHRRAAMGRG